MKKTFKRLLKWYRQWHEDKPVFLTDQQRDAFIQWYIEHHCGICGKQLKGFEHGDTWADNGRCLCEPCAEFVTEQRRKLPGNAMPAIKRSYRTWPASDVVGHC